MLEQKIVETFRTASDEQKAVMVGTIPSDMLSVGSEVYANLGNSQKVWLAYLYRVGVDGAKSLPQNVQQTHLLPLLQYDENTATIVILLKAGLFVDEAIAVLQNRPAELNGNMRTASDYTDGLRAIRERALPVILKMLDEEDPYKLQYAFHAFRIEEWGDQDSIQQLSKAVYAVLQRSAEHFILEHCARVLAVTDPEALIRFAIEVMKTWDRDKQHDHPIRKAGKDIVAAYQTLRTDELKQEFILASVAAHMPWFDLNHWDAVLVLATMGEETFKNALVGTSNYTRQNMGGSIRYMGDKPEDQVRLVVKVVTAVVYQLLDEGYPTSNLVGFLAQAQDTLAEDDYVAFMIKVAEQGGDVAELSQYHYYRDCTPEQVVGYMNRLSGIAKTDAALMLLHKLEKTTLGYTRYGKALSAAMDTIVAAYTKSGLPIRERSDESVQKVPVKHWKSYLETILKEAKAFWAVRFAVFTLKTVDENHQLANETLARMMLVEDDKIQWYLSRYLNG